MQASELPVPTPMTPHGGVSRPAPAPIAGVIGWFSLLVVLNLTTNPLVAGAAWVGCAALAIAIGHHRLVGLSLAVGLGMLLVIPGLSVAQGGGLQLTLGDIGSSLPERTVTGVAWAVASTLRVPAQVLACALMLAVPTRRLVDTISRRSHRTALLAGLIVRLRPLLRRDAMRVEDELVALGHGDRRSASISARMRTTVIVWHSMLMTMFDRAQSTARVLSARGVGPANAFTAESLRHPALADRIWISRPINVAIMLCSASAVLITTWARSIGLLPPPSITIFSGVGESVDVFTIIIAASVAGVALIPATIILMGRSRAGDYQAWDAHLNTQRVMNSEPCSESTRSMSVAEASVAVHHQQRPNHTYVIPERRVHGSHGDGHRVILDTPAISIAQGEFVLLAGAGGSGKSTLINHVLEQVQLGADGSRTSVVSMPETGALFQDPEQQVVLDVVADDTAQALRAAGMAIAEIENRVLEALHLLGVGHLAQRSCSSLSGGELQRVALAGVLARRPDVLVLDEPTAMLDEDGRIALWSMVDRVRAATGCSVLVAEHNIEMVIDRADRVLVLAEGCVAWDGPARDALPNLRSNRCLVPRIPAAGHTASANRFHVRNLRVEAPDGRVLFGVGELALGAGCVLGITGSNGSGKSSLLRSVRSLPQQASISWIDGIPIRHGMRWNAWVSQASSLVLAPTVLEHLARMIDLSGVTCNHIHALARAGLAHMQHAHPADLSVGERQRLAIAGCCVDSAVVWLLDEPSRALDATGRAWLAAKITDHALRGGIVLVASHDQWLLDSCITHQLDLAGGAPRVTAVRVHRSNADHRVQAEVSVPRNASPDRVMS